MEGEGGGTIELGSDVVVGFDRTRKPEVGASKMPNRSEGSGVSESPNGPEGAVAKESISVCIETATPDSALPFYEAVNFLKYDVSLGIHENAT